MGCMGDGREKSGARKISEKLATQDQSSKDVGGHLLWSSWEITFSPQQPKEKLLALAHTF